MENCPIGDHPGQDGDHGRDVTDNDDSDGQDGFAFTRLDENGLPLADQTSEDFLCVRDEVSGLVWQNKNFDIPRNIHYVDWQYRWRDTSGINDGGDPGVAGSGGDPQCRPFNCPDPNNPDCDQYLAQCDTETYLAAVNAETYCGFDDWRLPTIDELFTVAHMAERFRLVLPRFYHFFSWTQTTNPLEPSEAWIVTENSTSRPIEFASNPKSGYSRVHAVRGGGAVQ